MISHMIYSDQLQFKDLQPDWWRKMKIRVDHRGRIVQTIKSCPSMLDWLTMGYYIVASRRYSD